MRTTHTLGILAATVSGLSAQPVLPVGGASVAPGTTVAFQYDLVSSPHPSWSGGTEDHSNLSLNSTGSWVYSTAAATPNGASFPTANLAYSSQGLYNYFLDGPGGLDIVGYTSFFGSMNCNPGYRYLKYPFTYNQSETTSANCTGDNFGTPFNRTAQVVLDGDGYGTLVMPFGTFTNVLRIKRTHSGQDLGQGINVTWLTHEYYYYKPGLSYPLLIIVDDVTNGSASAQTIMLDPSMVGVKEALANDIGIEVYPVPATDVIHVRFGASGKLMSTLIDGAGRIVWTRDLGSRAPGLYEESFDLAGLASGLYTIRITDEHGGSGVKRFAVK